jgi:mannose-6-phosphate isomerase-like protein (cupin superfamily)
MTSEDGYTIKHRDEFERTGRWALARRSLGVTSFGMNLVAVEPGYAIPEHDETPRDHEEVFFVLSGDAVAVVGGEEHAAPAGTFVRVDPHVRRTIRNEGTEAVDLLIVSAPRSSGYEPLDWA